MATFQAELVEIYRGFADEYLVEKWQSGTLTDLAMKVADAELNNRGIAHRPMPKRELPQPGTGETIKFETVARALNSPEMQILQARLEAEGIPSWVADANINAYSFLSYAAGGARLQVPSDFAAAARKIITEVNSGALALDNDDDRPA